MSSNVWVLRPMEPSLKTSLMYSIWNNFYTPLALIPYEEHEKGRKRKKLPFGGSLNNRPVQIHNSHILNCTKHFLHNSPVRFFISMTIVASVCVCVCYEIEI